MSSTNQLRNRVTSLIWLHKGKKLLERDEPRKALFCFEAALGQDPLNLEASRRIQDLRSSHGLGPEDLGEADLVELHGDLPEEPPGSFRAVQARVIIPITPPDPKPLHPLGGAIYSAEILDMSLLLEEEDQRTMEIEPGPAPDLEAGEEDDDEPLADAEELLAKARDLFELGDFRGSLALADQALALDPKNDMARRIGQRNEEMLLRMYESRIGPLSHIPVMAMAAEEIIWLDLDHRAGFILSQIDGLASFSDIIDVSNMPRVEVCRILSELIQEGVVEPRRPDLA